MGSTSILRLFIFSKFNFQPTKSIGATTHFDSLLISRSYDAYRRPTSRVPDSQLYTRISLVGSSNVSLVPLLDQWVQEGNRVRDLELRRIIRLLRDRNRNSQALEVSEWMNTKKLCPFVSSDHALKLDLIAKVHGIGAAESYFKEIQHNSEKIYGSLLHCYVKERLVEKAFSLFEEMKKMGIAKSSASYNSIIALYMDTDQLVRVPNVLLEMKKNGVLPDNLSYRLCMKSYGLRSDLRSMEEVLKEMESRSDILVDWRMYTGMASFFMKAGLNEKAKHCLKKAEDKASGDPPCFRHLITFYANLGETSEVLRVWTVLKNSCRRLVNTDYITMLGSLVKLGEFGEAEKLFKDWESAGTLYDFRVPNMLLLGYTRVGQVEKAEEMLKDIIRKGMSPIPNSWSIVAAGYVAKLDMKKAFECMKKAVAIAPQHRGWEPKPDLVSCILKWLGDEGGIPEVEEFVQSLKQVVPMDKDMYHALIRANMRHGKDVDAILQSMDAEKIDLDEETRTILSSV